MKIDGFTKLTGIIGYPLSYTLSPLIHNIAFEKLGLNWWYLPLTVKEKDFPHAIPGLRALGFVGANVTIPYKEKVVEWVDIMDEEAQMIKAVNTLHFKDGTVMGYNTDGQGFLLSLRESGFNPKNNEVLVAGAGGAGKAAVFSLAKAGSKYIAILNRTPRRARALKKALLEKFPTVEVDVISFEDDLSRIFSRVKLVINATPVGTGSEKDEVSLPVDNLTSKHIVYDLIYSPPETPLLREAKKKGAKTINGLEMLLQQAAASFEIWTGVKPPIKAMRRALIEEMKTKYMEI